MHVFSHTLANNTLHLKSWGATLFSRSHSISVILHNAESVADCALREVFYQTDMSSVGL